MDKDTGLLPGGHVYFAHPMSDYGKDWERDMMVVLKDGFREYNIINPSETHHEPGWQEYGMKYFDKCCLPLTDILVFAGFQNAPFGENSISSGVAYEIDAFCKKEWARFKEPRVYEINRKMRTLHRVDPVVISLRYLDRFETRVMLRKYNPKYR